MTNNRYAQVAETFNKILHKQCTNNYLYMAQQTYIDDNRTFDDFCWRCYKIVSKTPEWDLIYPVYCTYLRTDREIIAMLRLALSQYEW